ncbi:GntR family transcriptional regulator [Paenibacillus yanchengensis]|uniref:GntR family transcriptional regulator n=1 Tax=Paenibacillus yanchengensis TaxID=2035833 RepID=A0ABW4YQD3_9BACL
MTLKNVSIKRNTLGEKAYLSIRDEIISLRMTPGEMIYEPDLAEKLGVSRTPVREAFSMLAKEELIEILPSRGARVAFISEQKVNEAQVVRETLEVKAFTDVAKIWDKELDQFKRAESKILDIIQFQKEAAAKKDYIRFVHLDEDFHNAVLEQAGNQTLLSVVYQMRGHLNRMRYLELEEAQHAQQAILQHEKLFQALQDNHVTEIERLLLDHLRVLELIRPEIMKKYSHYVK